MKKLNGPISDRLREKFPPEAPEWNPPRPGEPVENPGTHPARRGSGGKAARH